LPSLYVEGTLICFLLNAGLLVFFITRISSNLRAGDARWPTCASAPPKKTTSCAWACWPPARRMNWARRWPPSVILGDWKRMPEISQLPCWKTSPK
jgi:two-component system sensor histidine kinase RegB